MITVIQLISGAAGAALLLSGAFQIGTTLIGISLLIAETTKAK